MSDRIRLPREMGNGNPTEVAYYIARDLLRECGNNWLDYALTRVPEERYELARDGEKMAIKLSEAFGKLAALAEKEEA